MPSAAAPRDRCLATVLAAGGFLVLVGGLLHPLLPTGFLEQTSLMQTGRWRAAHLLLTFGQALAAAAVPAALRSMHRQRDGLWVASATGLGIGLVLGTVGTLLPATVLPHLAATRDAGLAGWLDADLAIGWLCSLLSGLAAVGLAVANGRQGGLPRILVWFGLSGGLTLVLANLLVPYHAHLTHNVILRAGALSLGLAVLALAATLWRAPRAHVRGQQG